ncbi:MAG: hypothetical protein DRP62_03705 [Planctomycetota bacterium]|nr:MAG: hypothetical protein DRP62_03705 [Planctomycetota bacterium]
MKVKKAKMKFRLLILLFALALFVQGAGATPIPPGGTLYDSHTETFTFGGGTVDVICEVYSYTSGSYVYTYQVENNSTVGLSFFSVELLLDSAASGPDWDDTVGDVDPAYWDIVDSYESVNASFVSAITNGQSSSLLWFQSDYAPTIGDGALFGFDSGMPSYASGWILTPMPEPATIALLGMGGVVTLIRRKRSA